VLNLASRNWCVVIFITLLISFQMLFIWQASKPIWIFLAHKSWSRSVSISCFKWWGVQLERL